MGEILKFEPILVPESHCSLWKQTAPAWVEELLISIPAEFQNHGAHISRVASKATVPPTFFLEMNCKLK